jgi:hypothetical protein
MFEEFLGGGWNIAFSQLTDDELLALCAPGAVVDYDKLPRLFPDCDVNGVPLQVPVPIPEEGESHAADS